MGPLIGGFIAQYSTWRWGFWSVAAANSAVQLMSLVFYRETYAPAILGQKAARLQRETGNMQLHTQWDDPDRKLGKLYKISLSRPWKLFFTQPIIQVLALYNAYNYSLLYLFISTYSDLWINRYGESTGIAGLNFVSLAIGNLAASQICAPLNDAIYRYLKRKYNFGEEEGIPEFRIPLILVGANMTPVGLFWVSPQLLF